MTASDLPLPDHINRLTRFSDRVENYIKYRPSYPKGLLDFMEEKLGLGPSLQVADVGSGTGIFAGQLLERGATVIAVEPNAEMRQAADQMLGGNPRYKSIAATAEDTGILPQSIDMITSAQAFHWFNSEQVRLEWKRILKSDGITLLVWNVRKESDSPFLRKYEELLLTYGTDYTEVRHLNVEENGAIELLFAPTTPKVFRCENEQFFDLNGLTGRLLSSSYAPAPGHPNHDPMIKALSELFHHYSHDGKVHFEYETKAYFGNLQ